jgi:ParB/RepB/Spo0J family partition protein
METQSLGQFIPLIQIEPSKTNPRKRFDEKELEDLAASIKVHGVMQPILVRISPEYAADELMYEIVAGERRYRASGMAGVKTIPAVIRELNDLETLQLQIIENLQRSDLHPLEEAKGFKALLDNKDAASWNADQLAEKIGKSRSYIYGALKLNDLCIYAQDMFMDGKFGRDGKHGREIALLIARIPGEKLQTQAAKEIAEQDHYGNSMSYRAALKHVQDRYTLKLSGAVFKITDEHLVPTAGSCKTCPSRSGNCPEAFPDIESPDVCTNPDCFNGKKLAHIAQLKDSGSHVLEGAAAKKIMPHSWDLHTDYVKLEDNCPGRSESLQKVLGKDASGVITIVDPNGGKLVQVAKKADVTAALQAKGIEVTFGNSRNYSAEEKEKERQIKIENNFRIKLLAAVSEKLKPQLETDYRLEDYEQTIVASVMLNRLDHDSAKRLLKLLEIPFTTDEGPHKAIGLLNNSLAAMTSAQRMLLVMQMALIGECYANQYNTAEPERLLEMAKNNGIDISSIREAAESQFAPKNKAAKNPKTASTPPIAAQANELEGAEKPDEVAEVAAPAEAKKLPPGMQKSKDAFLAKQARKNAKTPKDESANADVLSVPADKAAGTVTEVANA